MLKYRISIFLLVIVMFCETFIIKNVQLKNNIINNNIIEIKNKGYRKTELNIESMEKFNKIFKIKEMNKVNENTYLCYNVEGSLIECFEGIEYYIKNNYKIEDINLNFVNKHYVTGEIKMIF